MAGVQGPVEPGSDAVAADTAAADPSLPWSAEPGQRLPRGWLREAVTLVPDLGRLLRALVGDPRVPRRAKIIAGGAAAYVTMPFDLVPDVVPGLGAVDDLLVVLFAVRRLIAIAGYEIVRELWTGSDDGFAMLVVLAGVER